MESGSTLIKSLSTPPCKLHPSLIEYPAVSSSYYYLYLQAAASPQSRRICRYLQCMAHRLVSMPYERHKPADTRLVQYLR